MTDPNAASDYRYLLDSVVIPSWKGSFYRSNVNCTRRADEQIDAIGDRHRKDTSQRPTGAGLDSCTDFATPLPRRHFRITLWYEPEWRNWQTRWTQNPVPARAWRFKSSLRYWPELSRVKRRGSRARGCPRRWTPLHWRALRPFLVAFMAMPVLKAPDGA